MSNLELAQIGLYLLLLLICTPLLGTYMAKVYTGQPTWLTPVLRPVEKLIYRSSGVKTEEEMRVRRTA